MKVVLSFFLQHMSIKFQLYTMFSSLKSFTFFTGYTKSVQFPDKLSDRQFIITSWYTPLKSKEATGSGFESRHKLCSYVLFQKIYQFIYSFQTSEPTPSYKYFESYGRR